MRTISSFTLVGLLQDMIVVLGLPLKVATIILGCIFSILFSDFWARDPISIPAPLIAALTEFFSCRCRDKRPSIASIVIFNILAVSVPVFLYAYYVYVMI